MSPRSRSESAPRPTVLLESGIGSGSFAVDPRLAVEQVEAACLPRIGAARFAVRLDADFDLESARRRYLPDLRLAVVLDRPAPREPRVLFDGFCDSLSQRIARDGLQRERLQLAALGAAGRLAAMRDAQIVGRRMRERRMTGGAAATSCVNIGPAVTVESLSCTFDAGGLPNCDPTPVAIPSAGGAERTVHVFTWDGDPAAAPWTAARALRYLLAFHAPHDVRIDAAELFDATDAAAADSPAGRRAHRDHDRLRYDLLFPPAGLCIERLDMVAALGRLCAASGLLCMVDSRAAGAAIESHWRIGSRRDERAFDLNLARGGRGAAGHAHYDAAGRTIDDILRDNQIAAGAFEMADGRAARTVRVIGATIRRTLTVPLSPGWLPAEGVDNVAAPDRAAAKAAARTPSQVAALAGDPNDDDWFRRHHARGRDFHLNWQVARLWVLNEDGAFAGAAFDRHAPFDDYAAFAFHALLPTQDAELLAARRPRPLRAIEALRAAVEPGAADVGATEVETAALLTPGGIRVEISFDGGASWSNWPRAYAVLPGRAGLRFDVDNPLEVTPPHATAETQNLWYALIDQTFRVRVTAAFDGDRRLTADGGARRSVLRGLRPAARLAAAPALPLSESAARQALADLADDLSDRGGGSSLLLTPVIPWIEPEIELGRRIAGVRGRGVDLSGQASPTTRTAVVVGRTLCFEAERFGTTLLLEVERPGGEAPGEARP